MKFANFSLFTGAVIIAVLAVVTSSASASEEQTTKSFDISSVCRQGQACFSNFVAENQEAIDIAKTTANQIRADAQARLDQANPTQVFQMSVAVAVIWSVVGRVLRAVPIIQLLDKPRSLIIGVLGLVLGRIFVTVPLSLMSHAVTSETQQSDEEIRAQALGWLAREWRSYELSENVGFVHYQGVRLVGRLLQVSPYTITVYKLVLALNVFVLSSYAVDTAIWKKNCSDGLTFSKVLGVAFSVVQLVVIGVSINSESGSVIPFMNTIKAYIAAGRNAAGDADAPVEANNVLPAENEHTL